MSAIRTYLTTAVASIAVLGGAGALSGESALAASAVTGCATGPDDFDGNGGTDVALTAVQYDGRAADRGLVDVKMRLTSGVRNVRISPPNEDVTGFGASIAELDLSDHTDATKPCAALAISGFRDPGRVGVVFLYTWDPAGRDFHLLNTIRPADVGAGFSTIGDNLAAPTLPGNTPAPREPVLYARGVSDQQTAVARLTLTPQGTITSTEVIAPGATATDQMPLTTDLAHDFGFVMLGTPDPDQVIITDVGASIKGQTRAGAVLVWNRDGASQLLTESSPGVPGGPEFYDQFGWSAWLSTEASADADSPTYLFVGATGESIGTVGGAGAAYQFAYDPSTSTVSTTGARFWSQNSKGVAGQAETGDRFGEAFQSFTTNGGAPKYLVGAPGEAYRGRTATGVVDVLGDGRSFDNSAGGTLPTQPGRGYLFGRTLGASRNLDDNLADDPFPAPALGRWSADLLIGSRYDTVTVGLPAGTFSTPSRYVLDVSCPTYYCGYGNDLTPSGGG